MSGRAGVCIWFTGLSGSGKSTTADALVGAAPRARQREVTVLDGDVVRTHLSKGLGFSREDRDTNVRRIGYVASEVVRHGGIAVAAVVSPYRATRDEVRAMMPDGRVPGGVRGHAHRGLRGPRRQGLVRQGAHAARCPRSRASTIPTSRRSTPS